MKIRNFDIGDEVALLKVFQSAIHETAVSDYTAEQIAAWAPPDMDLDAWADRMKALCPFVLEIDGLIAGYADLQPNGYIDQFYVSAKFARQKVGTMLMKRIHEEAYARGMSSLTSAVSKTAEPFFLHHGFYVVRRELPVRRGTVLQNAVMRKDLQ